MIGAMVPATFEDVAEAHQVALDVGRWIFEGITHACLSCQIHHHPRPLSSEQVHEGRSLLQGKVFKTPGLLRCHGADCLQACLFQRGVVIAVEVVDADHAVAALKQALCQGGADEAGGTGHQDRTGLIVAHACPSPTRQRFNPAFSTS